MRSDREETLELLVIEVIRDFAVMLVSQVLTVPLDVPVFPVNQGFQANKERKAHVASLDNKVS